MTQLPTYDIITDTQGVKRVYFSRPVKTKDQTSPALLDEFKVQGQQIDWRDDQELWIWPEVPK